MALLLPPRPLSRRACVQLPAERSRSASAQRPLGFAFDPRFLSDCRFGRIERVSRGRLANMRESVLAVWREFHKRKLAHFRRPPSKL